MNFFEHQHQAKKKTAWLVLCMLAAVASLVLITTLAVGLFVYLIENQGSSLQAVSLYHTPFGTHLQRLFVSPLFFWIALIVAAFVFVCFFLKRRELKRGGAAVAMALGGRLLDGDARGKTERQLLNVVEEMAIASGNPVPRVFVLPEPGINAFAAGHTHRDAVIGVTEGCLQALDRSELQGVIAHEFSHIHNGDMRLNIRLVALLFGIEAIGHVGRLLLGRRDRSRWGSRRRRGHPIGAALIAIGYSGTFFGGLIKAAVSRQREFLADASAVQFTRYPQGIAGALKKIGGAVEGSQIGHPASSEYSHLFFGQGIRQGMFRLMATHPPLEQRIRRVEPGWDGTFPTVMPTAMASKDSRASEATNGFTDPATLAAATTDTADHVTVDPIEFACSATTASIKAAETLIQGLPASVYHATHHSFSARAVVFCLLLHCDKAYRRQQLGLIRQAYQDQTFSQVIKLEKATRALTEQALDIIDLCIPALKNLTRAQYTLFQNTLVKLIKADQRTSLKEWCLYQVCIRNISAPTLHEFKKLEHCREDLAVLFDTVIRNKYPGEQAHKTIQETMKSAALMLGLQALPMPQKQSIAGLDQAMKNLQQLRALQKPLLLKALLAVISHNGQIIPNEMMLFRAVADTLDCPIPPIPADLMALPVAS